MGLLIRFAKMEDAEELLALYTPYVTDTVPVSGRRTEWRDSWI